MRESGGEDALHITRPMRRRRAAFALLALMGVILLAGTMSSTTSGTTISGGSSAGASVPWAFGPTTTPSPKIPDLGKIPIAFEPNAGQAASGVQYLARLP